MKPKFAIMIAVLPFVLLIGGSASARQCFSLFGGADTVEINTSVTDSGPLNGREFGTDETDCGLAAFPIIGSAFKSSNGNIIFAFRSMTANDSNCGAVDFVVPLSGKPLSGTAQLRNDHNDFTNSTTMTQITCPKKLPGAEPSEAPSNGRDNQGNAP